MHCRPETTILLMVVPIYSCLAEVFLGILLNVNMISAQKFYTMSTKWTIFLNQNAIFNNFLFLCHAHCDSSLLIVSCQKMLLTNSY